MPLDWIALSFQYLSSEFLDGLYMEQSYNNGDLDSYVCPNTQVKCDVIGRTLPRPRQGSPK